MKYGSWKLSDLEELLDKLGEQNARRLLDGELVCRFTSSTLPRFPVSITYPTPPFKLMDQMLDDLECDFVNRDVNTHAFPINGNGTVNVDLALISFDRPLNYKEVLQEFRKLNLSPPKFEYGLAFGVAYPDEQRQGAIAIMCDPWEKPDGGRFVPYLDGDIGARYLHLHLCDGVWTEVWRFLAVHNQ